MLGRAAVLGNRVVPFFGIRKFRVDIENDTPEGVFTMPDHLAQMIFGPLGQHAVATPMSRN
jgi:hypothetical protein